MERHKPNISLLFDGQHKSECFVCNYGGKLVCCDYCEKVYHLECHNPSLAAVPKSRVWKCCECSADFEDKLYSCGKCRECEKRPCGECEACLKGDESKQCEFSQCYDPRFTEPVSTSKSAPSSPAADSAHRLSASASVREMYISI